MVKKSKPRSGSLAFYPRKRAARETPSFRTVKRDGKEIKPLNFIGYKAGMLSVVGKNIHEGSPSYGQEAVLAATVIETPPIKVFGIRAYRETPYGLEILTEVTTDNIDKELRRRIKRFKEKSKDKKKEEKKAEGKVSIEEIEKLVKEGKVNEIRLLAHTQPKLTAIGKKKPEVIEIFLNGTPEEQLKYAMEKLGKEITVKEVFNEKDFIDVKAVTKGKGFEGVVKRFGVKIQRPKAKKRRIVGSIGPWTPATVMWTVPRPGQHGYHSRTELNKKLILIGSKDETDKVNPKGGFTGYGLVKNDYIVIIGSTPGPRKRAVALRQAVREAKEKGVTIETIERIIK
ncbi:MAG: 50S ribosomal protein L3 [Candidatus Diapherotrites archaeon]|nr:50S ribosomal protein L3 [Candidatus Diapherotrites archaeon]